MNLFSAFSQGRHHRISSRMLSKQNMFQLGRIGPLRTLGTHTPCLHLRTRLQTQSLTNFRQQHTLVAPETVKLPTLLRFISNSVVRATHRSRTLSSSRAHNPFQPPPPSGPWRRFIQRIDGLPSNFFFWGILAANGAVFIAWQMATAMYETNRDASLYLWMDRNFTVSMSNFKNGRIWTLLTACFSHNGMLHLFSNAFTFYFMAPVVLSIMPNSTFLALYLGGGIIASLSSLWWNNAVKHYPNYSSHGASGAVYAVISFLAVIAPKAQFLIFGVIPVPAWAFVTGIFFYDGYQSLQDFRSQTDTAGHVGGLLAGIGFYLGKRFRVF